MGAGSHRSPAFGGPPDRDGDGDARAAGTVPLGVEIAAYLVCGLAGFVFGFEFGHQVTGGWGLGAITGLMGVLFCTILASAVLAWIERWLGGSRRRPG